MSTFLNNLGKPRLKVLILSIIVGLISICWISFDDDKDFELIKNMEIYYSVVKELRNLYVDEPDIGSLVKTSIEKMLESLDPYTDYYPESLVEDFRFMQTGEYGGIGATVIEVDKKFVITEIYPNFPAFKAGIKIGDVIIKVQNQLVDGLNLEQISTFFKGQPNTTIKLLLKRQGVKDLIEKEILREKIIIGNVSYSGVLKGNIGYIKLTGFTEGASEEVKRAFIKLKEQNKITSLILDLRDNPGGLLIEAVQIVNLFVDSKKEIVSMRGKVAAWNKTYYGTENPIDKNINLIVVVNRGSASASEIVAGALQDLDRAVIIGQRTFGKGLVQTTANLPYNAKMKITTAKYYIPSGRCIQAIDYSHRNEDGSVGKVPDSLITQFSTVNGRKVYDGGGILPDFITDKIEYTNITKSLLNKNLIFDFVTNYCLTHDSLNSPETFDFGDSEYETFTKFLENKDFDYQTESEKAYKELIRIAKVEKYYDNSPKLFNDLKNMLSHDKQKDLAMFKNELKILITHEIISRYFYQNGRIESELRYDLDVQKAIDLTKNVMLYKSTLGIK